MDVSRIQRLFGLGKKNLASKGLSPLQTLSTNVISAPGYALEPRIMLDAAMITTGAEELVDANEQQATSNQEVAAQNAQEQSQLAEALANVPSSSNVVYLIDSSVEDHETLLAGLPDNAQVHTLSSSATLAEIASILSGYQNLDSIHLFTHGSAGSLALSGETVDSDSLATQQDSLVQIGASLSEQGDILLYGCDVGQTSEGQAFVEQLAALTGADIAASDDLTGAAELGGDWELETRAGEISASVFLGNNYQSTLDLEGAQVALNWNGVVFDGPTDIVNEPVTGAELDFFGVSIDIDTIDSTTSRVTLTYDSSPAYNYELEFSAGTLGVITGVATDSALTNGTGSLEASVSGTNKIISFTASGIIDAVFVFDVTSISTAPPPPAPATPVITSSTYDASTGTLVVTGTDFVANTGATNDVDTSLLTLTGDGGSTYTLTSSDVEITSATEFTITLNAADQLHINGLLNKNSTSADDGTSYNLAAADDWMPGADAATDIADATGNGVTVSNVQTPTITSTTYDANTGVFVVTGTNFVHEPGAVNDIDISQLTFTGDVGGTYTLTSASNVEVTSATSFTVTLSGADKTAVDALLNSNGTSAADTTTYNLAAADNWLAGAAASVDIADSTASITVSNVNNVPTATGIPSDVSVMEDVASNLDLSAITFADADGDSLIVTLTASAGTLAVTNSGSVTVSGSSTSTLTLTGTADEINTWLDTASNIQYTGATNANGNDAATLTIAANDSNGSGDVNLGTVNVDINAINDIPVATGIPSDIAVEEDVAGNFDLSDVIFSDVDSDNLTVILTASAGTLAAASGGSVTVSGSSTSTLTLSGTVTSINTWLKTASNIQYTGATNVNGNDAATVAITANDNDDSGDVNLGTVNVDITADNDNPVATGIPSDIAVTEDVAGNFDLSTVTFSDVDSDNLTVILTASAGTLAASTKDGVTVSGSTTGTLTLSGTVTSINTWLNTASNIQYTGATNANGNDAATVTITANDNDDSGDVNLGTVNVDINAINDIPVATGIPSDIAVEEDVAGNFDLSDVIFSDVDSDNLTVILTASAGTLAASTSDGVTVSGSTTGTLTLSGTVTSINTWLNTASNIQYTGATNVNGNDAATVAITANDNDDSGDVNLGTVNVDITADNDNPVATGIPSDIAVTEDVAGNFDLSTVTFSDIDSDNLTVILTASAGTLAAASGGSVTVSGSSTSTLTLSGTVTNINTWLNTASNIQYTGATNANGNDAATVAITANDNDDSGDVNLGTVNVDINAINDIPVATGIPSDIAVEEDVAGNFDLSDVIFSDVDGDNLTVILTASAGTLSASSSDDVTVGGSSTGTLTLMGTADEINTWLDTASNIQYTGATNANGNDAATVTIAANDGSPSDVNLGTVNVDINAINDIPVATGIPSDITVEEDVAGNFDLSTVTFSDVDSDNLTVILTASAGTLAASTSNGVTVSGSTTGTLTLSGTVTSINTWLNTASNIQYTGATNVNGNDAATVAITANDNDDSGDVNLGTVNVDITAVNDPSQVGGTFTGSVTEGNVGDGAVTATGSLTISDIDVGDDPAFDDVVSTRGAGGYGDFVLSGGTWTYTLDQTKVQHLDAGDMVNDTILYTATDSTTQTITVTITGSNDAPVISGSHTGSVTEGNIGDAATASGSLGISDVDVDDTPSFNDVISTTGANGYGSFVLNGGTWTYTLDQSAVQHLDAGDTVTDTILYTATGSPMTQTITVTITGSNDVPVVSGSHTGSVTEGNIGDAAVTATGSLSISDVDDANTPNFDDVVSTRGTSNYGDFVLTGGSWTYTLDQTEVQHLDAGDTVNDTILYTATDGTPQTITVTITGSNDVPVVSGTHTGGVTEGNIGDAATASGSLGISDVDVNDTPSFNDVISTTGANGYGSFVLNGGTWTYTLDQSTVQDLDAGDTITDTILYTATDNITTQTITVTITGSNDVPVISGSHTGSVTEGNVGDAPVTASGTLGISDVDDADSPVFNAVDTTRGANGHGDFVLLSNGNWTYTLDQSVVQDLDAGDTVTDTILYTASDNTTQTITVTITGSNDVSVISGTHTGGVTEGNIGDAPVTASGTLGISDVDDADSPVFNAVDSTRGANNYGDFVLLSNGNWTYTLDQSAVQDLDAGDTINDTILYTATDGTPQTITVTITGSDDVPVVSGTHTGGVTEGNIGDAPVTASGTLGISDVDDADSPVFNAVDTTRGANNYGDFVLLSNGNWTYTLDQSAVQHLDAGDTVTDTILYAATDNITTQTITVTITGSNDVSVISGSHTGSVTEGNIGDAPVTASGTLGISDVDDADSPVFNAVDSTLGANEYGDFVLLSNGNWTYTLDQSAVQDLDDGDTVTDTIVYTATDNTTQTITVTITGSNDVSVISGTHTGGVTEGNIGDAPVTASGTLGISDVDDADSPVFNAVDSTRGANNYGDFVLLSNGNWTYTLDQSAVQELDAGDTVTDTIVYTATDKTTQTITVTITGSNDVPVISGTHTGSVTEGNIGDAPVTASGTLGISDVDDADSPVFNAVDSTLGANKYGDFVLLSNGNWTYTLGQSAVQDLDAGDTVTDTIVYTATDNTTQTITVTITGSNDVSVISGDYADAVDEGDLGDPESIVTGALGISDVDGDDSPVFSDQDSTRGANNYGDFVLENGTWTYTLDQTKVQDLEPGQSVTDSILYTATDGSEQTITITINGTYDTAILVQPTGTAITAGGYTVGDFAPEPGTPDPLQTGAEVPVGNSDYFYQSSESPSNAVAAAVGNPVADVQQRSALVTDSDLTTSSYSVQNLFNKPDAINARYGTGLMTHTGASDYSAGNQSVAEGAESEDLDFIEIDDNLSAVQVQAETISVSDNSLNTSPDMAHDAGAGTAEAIAADVDTIKDFEAQLAAALDKEQQALIDLEAALAVAGQH